MNILNVIATLSVISALASSAVIAADLTGRKQPMRIMNAVWILTGLWGGVFALWAYFRFGRARAAGPDMQEQPAGDSGMAVGNTNTPAASHRAESSVVQQNMLPVAPEKFPASMGGTNHGAEMPEMGKMPGMPDMKGMHSMSGVGKSTVDGDPQQAMHEAMPMQAPGPIHQKTDMPDRMKMHMDMGPRRPDWQNTALSTLHCGAGCTLADLIGEWFVVAVPVAVGGSLIAGSWVLDYMLALVIGIGFQYAAIRSMEVIRPGRAIVRAAKADILSLTAWQIGMYGWMAIVYFVFFRDGSLDKASWTFWFMMQLAMCFGFLASYPMNKLLIRLGIKKGM